MGSDQIEIDAREVAVPLRLINQLEKMRPGLGLPMVYLMSRKLGAFLGSGAGLFVVGRMAMGKGALIYGTQLPEFSGFEVEAAGDLDPRWLSKQLESRAESGKAADLVNIIIEDMSPISGSPRKLNKVLTAGGWGVSNLRFTDKGWQGKSTKAGSEQFSGFFMVCGMTPRVLGLIQRHHAYPDMWVDRFPRFGLIRTAYDANRIRKLQRDGSPSDAAVAATIARAIPEQSDESPAIDIPGPELIAGYQTLYGRQLTEERGTYALRCDLRGLAMLSGSDVATSDHLNLLLNVAPFLWLGGFDPRIIELVQHGAEGQRPQDGNPIPLPVIAGKTKRSLKALMGNVYEAHKVGLIEYRNPTGRPAGVSVWPHRKLSILMHNLHRLRQAGASLGRD